MPERNIKSQKIRIEDISISYYIKSSRVDSPKTVIFLHGFPFNKNTWRSQLDCLADDVTGIALDIRGHGNSTSGHGFFSVDVFAKDLKLFIEKLNLTNVFLCGVSMGGYIALRYQALYPNRIAGLILSDTHHLPDDNTGKKKRFDSIQAILKHGRRPFAIGFVENIFTENTLSEQSECVELIKSAIRRNSIRNICATQLALASRTDSTPYLHEINIPTLLIRGSEDRITPLEFMEQMQELMPNSTFISIPEAGHLPNLEQSDLFNNHLNDFLKKN